MTITDEMCKYLHNFKPTFLNELAYDQCGKNLTYDKQHVKNESVFTSFRDITMTFRLLFLDRFLCLSQGHFSRSWQKI